jgi:hypothetical protein
MSWVAVGVVGASVVAGAVAGSMGDHSSSQYTSGIDTGPMSAMGTQGQDMWTNSATQLGDIVNAGPGKQDASNAYKSNQDLASLLQQYSQGGYMPNGTDINNANSLSSQLFAPQQAALNNSFTQATTDANRQAALMGRSPNDPVLAAKLAQYKGQQQGVLSAQQGAYAAQYANAMPQMRLGYAQQSSQVLNGLATQAMANRQALAGMGSNMLANQQNWMLNTGTRWSNGSQDSGGGVKGAIEGGLAGAGSGMSMMSGMGSFSPSTPAPAAAPSYSGGPSLGANYGMFAQGAPSPFAGGY